MYFGTFTLKLEKNQKMVKQSDLDCPVNIIDTKFIKIVILFMYNIVKKEKQNTFFD